MNTKLMIPGSDLPAIRALRSAARKHGLSNTQKAIGLALQYHATHSRDDGEAFVQHPACVAQALYVRGIRDDCLLACAMLHDVLEESCGAITKSHLCGPNGIDTTVYRSVRLLTKTDEDTRHYYRSLEASKSAALVKIADRWHNLATMAGVFDLRRMRKYIRETELFVLPLCEHVARSARYRRVVGSFETDIQSLLGLSRLACTLATESDARDKFLLS